MIRAAGSRALLVELDSEHEVAAFSERLRAATIAGVDEIVPAARTVLVTTSARTDLEIVRRALSAITVDVETSTDDGIAAEPVVIPVRYDGADLDDVARHLGMTVAEVVAAHTAAQWRCAFIGFAPGFGYLSCGDESLTVPRRTRARTSVPAGAVALAGGYSAVYPRSSPGGWQIIGTTDTVMWDLDADPPARVQPGSHVRFVDESTR